MHRQHPVDLGPAIVLGRSYFEKTGGNWAWDQGKGVPGRGPPSFYLKRVSVPLPVSLWVCTFMHSFPVGQTKELPGYAARASPLAQLGAAQGHGRLARAAARALLLLLRLRRRSQPRRAAHHQPCAREQGASAAPGCCWEPRAPRRASRRVMTGRHRTVRRGRVGAPRLPTARAAGVPRRCADGHVVTRAMLETWGEDQTVPALEGCRIIARGDGTATY